MVMKAIGMVHIKSIGSMGRSVPRMSIIMICTIRWGERKEKDTTTNNFQNAFLGILIDALFQYFKIHIDKISKYNV